MYEPNEFISKQTHKPCFGVVRRAVLRKTQLCGIAYRALLLAGGCPVVGGGSQTPISFHKMPCVVTTACWDVSQLPIWIRLHPTPADRH